MKIWRSKRVKRKQQNRLKKAPQYTLKKASFKLKRILGQKDMWSVYHKTLDKRHDFRGRASRYDFWSFTWINFLAFLFFSIMEIDPEKKLLLVEISKWFEKPGVVLAMFCSIYLLIVGEPWLAITVRRLHDIGLSARKILEPFLWLTLTLVLLFAAALITGNYVPGTKLVGLLFYMYFLYLEYLLCKKGMLKDNKYGRPVIEDREYYDVSTAIIIFLAGFPVLVFVLLIIAPVVNFLNDDNMTAKAAFEHFVNWI